MGLHSLETLWLDRVAIETIESGAFQDCGNVTELDLVDVPLKHIKSFAFSGLTSLEKLSIRDIGTYMVETIEPFAFYGMTSVTEIDFNSCFMTVISTNTYTGLPALEILYLSENHLVETIEVQAFNDLPSLKELWIDFNFVLRRIEPGAFYNLPALVELQVFF